MRKLERLKSKVTHRKVSTGLPLESGTKKGPDDGAAAPTRNSNLKETKGTVSGTRGELLRQGNWGRWREVNDDRDSRNRVGRKKTEGGTKRGRAALETGVTSLPEVT